MISPLSFLYASDHKTGYEVLLYEWINDENREHAKDHDRHLRVVVDVVAAAKGLISLEDKTAENNLQRILAAVVDEHDDLEVPVPVADEIEEDNSCDDGDRERYDDTSVEIKNTLRDGDRSKLELYG